MRTRPVANLDASLHLLDGAIERIGQTCFDIERDVATTAIVVTQLLALREARAELQRVREGLVHPVPVAASGPRPGTPARADSTSEDPISSMVY